MTTYFNGASASFLEVLKHTAVVCYDNQDGLSILWVLCQICVLVYVLDAALCQAPLAWGMLNCIQLCGPKNEANLGLSIIRSTGNTDFPGTKFLWIGNDASRVAVVFCSTLSNTLSQRLKIINSSVRHGLLPNPWLLQSCALKLSCFSRPLLSRLISLCQDAIYDVTH